MPSGARRSGPRGRHSPDRIGARPGRGPEHQHGLGDEVARGRPIPPAAERAVARGLLAQPAPPPRRSERLPDRGPPHRAREHPGHALGRRLARRLQVLRRRPELAEHPPPGLPAGQPPVGGPGVSPEGLQGRGRSDCPGGRARPLLLQRHRLQPRNEHRGRLRQPVLRPEHEGERRRRGRHDRVPRQATRSPRWRGARRRRHQEAGPVPRQAVDCRRHPGARARRRARPPGGTARVPSPATSTWRGAKFTGSKRSTARSCGAVGRLRQDVERSRSRSARATTSTRARRSRSTRPPAPSTWPSAGSRRTANPTRSSW